MLSYAGGWYCIFVGRCWFASWSLVLRVRVRAGVLIRLVFDVLWEMFCCSWIRSCIYFVFLEFFLCVRFFLGIEETEINVFLNVVFFSVVILRWWFKLVFLLISSEVIEGVSCIRLGVIFAFFSFCSVGSGLLWVGWVFLGKGSLGLVWNVISFYSLIFSSFKIFYVWVFLVKYRLICIGCWRWG